MKILFLKHDILIWNLLDFNPCSLETEVGAFDHYTTGHFLQILIYLSNYYYYYSIFTCCPSCSCAIHMVGGVTHNFATHMCKSMLPILCFAFYKTKQRRNNILLPGQMETYFQTNFKISRLD